LLYFFGFRTDKVGEKRQIFDTKKKQFNYSLLYLKHTLATIKKFRNFIASTILTYMLTKSIGIMNPDVIVLEKEGSRQTS